MILAGDIGGTNTRLALFDTSMNKLVEKTYISREYNSLSFVVEKFLSGERKRPECAAFALAGPVKDGKCSLTNLSWNVDAQELSKTLSIEKVFLLNDVEANGWGIGLLKEKDLFVLHHGVSEQKENACLIAAGTGLGEAGLYWNGKEHMPFACEGGHTDFAPRNVFELEFLDYVFKMYPEHVSYERVVSGKGLYLLLRFLIDSGREKIHPDLQKEMQETDPASVIYHWGVSKKDPVCKRVVDWFLSLYGAEAGNMALKYFALGGVYVGGGIAPKMLEAMKGSSFMEGFLSKGRFRSLLETIPVHIILNDKTALLGAAAYGRRRGF